MRRIAVLLLLAASVRADSLQDYLRGNGRPPVEYILSKFDRHNIVLLGESHWIRHDAELVASLVPELRRRGIALAIEVSRASDQEKIDRLLNGAEWNPQLALEILTGAEWPYVQYRDIFQAAWRANREARDAPPMRIVALGPPADWRAQGISYDGFMAGRLLEHVKDGERQVLVYCGMHHAFTRYLQPERRIRGRATEFMDRFGNILWRRHGENVFLIALHKPEMCGPEGENETRVCLPLRGSIDCAAASLGAPVGFDILGSPIAEEKFPKESFYVVGHPSLRLVDYADGYVWTAPIDATRMVDLIPVETFAKDDEVAGWNKHAEWLAHPLDRPAWKHLARWRDGCH